MGTFLKSFDNESHRSLTFVRGAGKLPNSLAGRFFARCLDEVSAGQNLGQAATSGPLGTCAESLI